MNAGILLWVLATGLTLAGPLPESEIISQADARIEKYRTGKAVLRLTGPSGQPVSRGRRVRIEQTGHKFLFGSSISYIGSAGTPAKNAAYEAQFAHLMNYATLGLEWKSNEPKPGRLNYGPIDDMLAWCQLHKVTPKGAALAYNLSEPSWLPSNPSAAMQTLLAHIERTASGFKKQITIWDVVDEATHFDGNETRAGAPRLTEAINRMGVAAYVRAAFEAARKGNPSAILVINDYDYTQAYTQNVISKLVDSSGQPLYDVIGIQSHQHEGAWSPAQIWEICERLAAFGKPLHFTELTILSDRRSLDLKKTLGLKWEGTPQGERRQAEEAARFYTIAFSHPAVEAITWWDFSDLYAWRDAPSGLLRADMTPKPAYDTLSKLIKGKWWTRTEAPVEEHGEAHFHGFFGEYRVVVTEGQRELTGKFSFDKGTQHVIEVHLN